MKLISHRGNLRGPNKKIENDPKQVEKIISLGFDCEIDLRIQDAKLFLGHDSADFHISIDWLTSFRDKLWIHCKDLQSLNLLSDLNSELNFFWHETDSYTITSKGNIWVFPGKPVSENGILVLPEITGLSVMEAKSLQCLGICTDYVEDYL